MFGDGAYRGDQSQWQGMSLSGIPSYYKFCYQGCIAKPYIHALSAGVR